MRTPRSSAARRRRLRAVRSLIGLLLIVTMATGIVVVLDTDADRGAAHAGAAAVARPSPSPQPDILHVHGRGRVQTLQVPDRTAPGGYRSVVVYRPAVPDTADVPVVYFLHGLPGSATDLLSQGAARVLDETFASGTVRPFVLAFPDGNLRDGADSEWTDSADGSVKLESFVTGALISAVEGAHRRDRAHRALAGFSMGGYGATEIALRHSDIYSQVASLAGYFHIDDPDHMFGSDPSVQAQHDPDRQVDDLRAFRLLLLDGANDEDPVTQGETARFTAVLRARGITVTSEITPGRHTITWATRQLPAVAGFLAAGWPPVTGNPGGHISR